MRSLQAIIEGVVIEYKDIYKDAVEKNLTCATDVPYFEGDFWPNVLEESIKVRVSYFLSSLYRLTLISLVLALSANAACWLLLLIQATNGYN